MQFIHVKQPGNPLQLGLAAKHLRVLLYDIGKRIGAGQVIFAETVLQILKLHLIIFQRLHDLIQLHFGILHHPVPGVEFLQSPVHRQNSQKGDNNHGTHIADKNFLHPDRSFFIISYSSIWPIAI